jgi:hypothetical protein
MTDPENHPAEALVNPIRHVLAELNFIRQYWVTFGCVAVICAGATWYLASSYYTALYAQQIDTGKSNNAYLRDRLRGMTESTPPSQWRRLSDSARGQILASMRTLSPMPKTLVLYAVAETEPRQYASQFADAFRSIGIKVEPREVSSTMFAPPEIGLMVGISTFPNPTPEATAFKEVLVRAGLDVHHVAWTGAEIDNEKFAYDLYIGSKPW